MSPSNSGYSQRDIARMQQEAVQRVKVMQERANKTLGEKNHHSMPMPEIHKHDNHKLENRQEITHSQGNSPFGKASFLNGIKLDNDTLILGGLIFLLLYDGADITVILALCYILFM